ncbi:division/cell wall cluster transcriptional repressor MraZ [bacterium]|nr:MAG: division/cell wall cluster transcriptional repressor MraZ [bacterium]
MFQGHSLCSLDEKQRIVLPLKFRKYLSPEADNKLILTRGMDLSILVYPNDAWEKMIAGLSRFNVFKSSHRSFVRQLLMYVNVCELDSHNRILIPTQLMQFANIKKEVVINGLLDKFEIWDPETKNKYESQLPESYEEMAERASDLFFGTNKDESL